MRRNHSLRRIAFCVTPSVLIGLAAWGGPLDRTLVPESSGWVAHINVEAAINGKVAQGILKDAGNLDEGGMKDLKAFGIDPLKDLKGITVFGTGKDDDKDGVLLVEATAAVDKLWDHLKTEPNSKAMNVDGVEMLSWDDNGERRYGVVRPGKGEQTRLVYLASDWAPISAAVAAAGKGKPLANPGGPGPGAILYIEARVIPEAIRESDDENASAMFKALRSGWFEVGEKDATVYATMDAEFADAKTATDMRQVVDGLMAFARLAGGQNPEMGEIIKVLNAVKIETKDTALIINAAWPTEEVIKAMKQAEVLEGHDADEKGEKDDKDQEDDAE